MKTELLVLKSKLYGLEHASRKFRKRIVKLKGVKRAALRIRKHELGIHTREHLIAYGLLRNVPYDKIERKCAEGNEPNVDRILSILVAHVPMWERQKWTKSVIDQLLQRNIKS